VVDWDIMNKLFLNILIFLSGFIGFQAHASMGAFLSKSADFVGRRYRNAKRLADHYGVFGLCVRVSSWSCTAAFYLCYKHDKMKIKMLEEQKAAEARQQAALLSPPPMPAARPKPSQNHSSVHAKDIIIRFFHKNTSTQKASAL
jgi:hypothetical protein